MHTPHNRRHMLALLGALGCSWPLRGQAQSERPVKLILPVSAGSGVDAIARAASAQLGKALGQSVVIDNQPGAGGVVGAQALVRALPDGQTLGMVSNNHVIYPSVIKNLPFDPVADFTPIVTVVNSPMVLVVNPKVPANNLQEFISLLKAHPGRYNYASSGNGTILHLAAELFKDATGTFSTHIPYRGFGQMLQDIVGGQIDWGVGALGAVSGQVKAGALKALCVATSERMAALPNVPTAAEQGVAGFQIGGWSAVVGPKGMAPELVKRVHAAVVTAYNTPEVREAMAKQGNSLLLQSSESTQAFFKSELARYAALVKKAGVVAQ
jgi:tripartite-type tricarboxylate transporter receptor subunit TctC